MRLIDADEFEKEIRFYAKTLYQNIKHSRTKDFQPSRDFVRGVEDGYCRILSALQAQPTIDPVKHGRWKKTYLDHEAIGERPSIFYCSVCNQCIAYPVNYCPSCGADMRGEEDENNNQI